MITPRQHDILQNIIESHIQTGEPIPSKLLAEESSLEVSPATIRNEMALLEKEGYIFQPHVSSGSIPTEKAYKYYIKNCLQQTQLSPRERKNLGGEIQNLHRENTQPEKSVAKVLAHFSDETIIIAFSKDDIYYTGISNIFRKPEFQSLEESSEWGELIDRFDEIVEELYTRIASTTILLGHENPFSERCGLIATRYGKKREGMLTILGPLRMDYGYNQALIEYAKQYLSS